MVIGSLRRLLVVLAGLALVFTFSIAGSPSGFPETVSAVSAKADKPCKPTPKRECPTEEPTESFMPEEEGIVRSTSHAQLLQIDAFSFDQGQGGAQRADRTRNLTVVGHEDFGFIDGPGGNTDVWALGNFAYVGTFGTATGCANGTGVKIIDVSDPENPVFVNDIPKPDTQVNDVKVIRANSRFFSGALLGHSNEDVCPGSTADSTGIELWDVTDPLNPVHLSSIRPLDSLFGFPLGVHNLYLIDRGKELFALLNTEGFFDNFQIWDITDPTSPVQRGTWGAEQICDPGVAVCTSPIPIIVTWLFTGRGTSANRFLHDVWASENGKTAYLSNWDAGMITLDISDVDSPVFLSASPFAGADDEGNSHAAVPARGGNLVIEASEDFEATRIAVTVTSGPLASSVFGLTEDVVGPPPPRFADVGVIGPVEAVFLGRLCDSDPVLNAGAFDPGDIAVVRRGACDFSEKLLNAQGLGASAILIANNIPGAEPLGNGSFQGLGGIPGGFLSTADGDLFEANPTGNIVVIDPSVVTFNPWGFVRIYDTRDPTNPVLLSTFETEASLNLTGPPDPDGTFSVHNVWVRGNTAYFSWYSEGVLVLDFSKPNAPREIARFNPTGPTFEAENGGIQDVWGIYTSGELIFASDRNGGLYILKHVP